MGNCKDCRWWLYFRAIPRTDQDWACCDKISLLRNTQSKAKIVIVGRHEKFTTPLVYTAPDYGCNQFEAVALPIERALSNDGETITIGVYGMPIKLSEDVPPGEIWCTNGETTIKIVNVKAVNMGETDAS